MVNSSETSKQKFEVHVQVLHNVYNINITHTCCHAVLPIPVESSRMNAPFLTCDATDWLCKLAKLLVKAHAKRLKCAIFSFDLGRKRQSSNRIVYI